ncbi:MAG: MobQ family relaxase [Xenococcaceae cyanobacterium MO_188.B29]|nr:MobQ family relaxase [Xenococcaceae cyanobacterium MO_188.B29]
MAIYYFNASVISRSKGRSATASAAYRAGEKILDIRTGEIHDYRQKKGVDEKIILAPNSAPDWVKDRASLWNEVERVERRKNSQLAREIKLAIPVELDRTQQLELVQKFVTEQFVSQGMVADVTFHDLDSHNPHAHIMLTMREIDEHGFSPKKNRDWNKRELLEKQREAWAVTANLALEKAGIKEAIDHRTLVAQGINRIPQIHLGAAVTAMMKRGILTEKEERYREIELANRNIQKWEFHLELLERMESIYKNSPELDPIISDSTPTQQQTVEPPQEEQPISQPLMVTNSQPLEPPQESKTISQPNHDTFDQPTELEKPPSAITLQQQQQVIKTASRFLHLMGEDVWNSDQGYYHLMTNHQNLLVIRAKDNRGEILRYEHGNIVTQRLTSEDVEKFKKINALLDQKLSEVSSRQLDQRSQPESEL